MTKPIVSIELRLDSGLVATEYLDAPATLASLDAAYAALRAKAAGEQPDAFEAEPEKPRLGKRHA